MLIGFSASSRALTVQTPASDHMASAVRVFGYRKVLSVLSTVARCRYSGWLLSDSTPDSLSFSSSSLWLESVLLRTELWERRSRHDRIIWARSCWSRWKFSLRGHKQRWGGVLESNFMSVLTQTQTVNVNVAILGAAFQLLLGSAHSPRREKIVRTCVVGGFLCDPAMDWSFFQTETSTGHWVQR